MKDKPKPESAAATQSEPLKPTPELLEMIRKRFPPEGKAERVARSLAALAEAQKAEPIKLSHEDWKIIAENDDLLEQ